MTVLGASPFTVTVGFTPATDPNTLIGIAVGDRVRVTTRIVAFWPGTFEGTVADVQTDEYGVYLTTAEPVRDASGTAPFWRSYDLCGTSPHGFANSIVDAIVRL
jgi:hypothetical protein